MTDFAVLDGSHSQFSSQFRTYRRHSAPRSDTSGQAPNPVFASDLDDIERSGTGDIESITNPAAQIQPQWATMGSGWYVSPSAPEFQPGLQDTGYYFNAVGTGSSMEMTMAQPYLPAIQTTGVPFESAPFDPLGASLQGDVTTDELNFLLQSDPTLTDINLSMDPFIEAPVHSHLTDLGAHSLAPPQPMISQNSVSMGTSSLSSRSTRAAQSFHGTGPLMPSTPRHAPVEQPSKTPTSTTVKQSRILDSKPDEKIPKARHRHDRWNSVLMRVQHSNKTFPNCTLDGSSIWEVHDGSIKPSFDGFVALARKYKSQVCKWGRDHLSVSAADVDLDRYTTRTAIELHCGEAMRKWYEQTLADASGFHPELLAKSAELTVSEFLAKPETAPLASLFTWDHLKRFLHQQSQAQPVQVIEGWTVSYARRPPRAGQEALSRSMPSYFPEGTALHTASSLEEAYSGMGFSRR